MGYGRSREDKKDPCDLCGEKIWKFNRLCEDRGCPFAFVRSKNRSCLVSQCRLNNMGNCILGATESCRAKKIMDECQGDKQ